MRSRILFLLVACNLTSCFRDHFYVQHELIDRNFLASSHVKTPDPRQEAPPDGQRLIVSWEFPRSLFEEELQLQLTVRFWNDTQEIFVRPIEKRRDYAVFFFPNVIKGVDRRILTYRVRAISKKGEIVGVWEHQLWTNLIEVGKVY